MIRRLLNKIGIYTKAQVAAAFENGRRSEMHKMYVINTEGLILKSSPDRWLEKELATPGKVERYVARNLWVGNLSVTHPPHITKVKP